MALSAFAAAVYLPFVLPLCLYVAFTDMREMRITNQSVIVLGALFIMLGLIALPWQVYLLQLTHLPIVLCAGILLTAAGAMGAGDAKFIAAASPFVMRDDVMAVAVLFAAALLAAVAAHRTAKYTSLRKLVPHWTSWDQGHKFPMGLALGFTLAAYLLLALVSGL